MQRLTFQISAAYLFLALLWVSHRITGALEGCSISMLFFHYCGLTEIYMDIEVGWSGGWGALNHWGPGNQAVDCDCRGLGAADDR